MSDSLKDSFVNALKERCVEVIDERHLLTGESHSSYNPYNITVLMEFDASPAGWNCPGGWFGKQKQKCFEPLLNLKATLNLKTVAGEEYETRKFAATGNGKLGIGTRLLAVIPHLVTLGSVDTSTGQQMVKASEDAIEKIMKQAMRVLDDAFSDKFAEFTAYSMAVKSKSENDLKYYCSRYPQGEYIARVRELLDTQMYETARAGNELQAQLEYLDGMPDGKYRAEVRKAAEPLMYDAISRGNMDFCHKYPELAADESRAKEVKKLCESRHEN